MAQRAAIAAWVARTLTPGGLVARLHRDSLDNLRLPRSGTLLDAGLFDTRPALGGTMLTARAAAASSPHSLQLGGEALLWLATSRLRENNS